MVFVLREISGMKRTSALNSKNSLDRKTPQLALKIKTENCKSAHAFADSSGEMFLRSLLEASELTMSGSQVIGVAEHSSNPTWRQLAFGRIKVKRIYIHPDMSREIRKNTCTAWFTSRLI